ncbi:hypothetical protein HGA13_02870 [Nocardia speluncae]|uniref:Uncharacterized protein n=1 Tax=Nocardia speluncae TaxID=419477 RepID=A0A846X975_9NOCA|nr:hypothetical protein [Nocardia speluncae]NKY32017.1 hypothetical protein [Nocardia speluncae]
MNAWVKQLAAQGLILFYSADDDNIASHRVAQKCKATPLGHLIHITPAVTAGWPVYLVGAVYRWGWTRRTIYTNST